MLRAAAPAGGAPDGAARPGPVPRRDLAAAARALRVHLGRLLRGPARLRGRRGAPHARRRQRAGLDRRSSTSDRSQSVGRGGRRDRGRRRASSSAPRSPTRTATTRPLTEADVLVVAPYNAQVRMLRSRLPAGVAVGTVDKFQGQQAPVVFVSMASSTAEDAPRGVGFAFDSHRFNVATSRAQCRAVLVCAPGAARRRLQDDRADAARQRRLPVRRAVGFGACRLGLRPSRPCQKSHFQSASTRPSSRSGSIRRSSVSTRAAPLRRLAPLIRGQLRIGSRSTWRG